MRVDLRSDTLTQPTAGMKQAMWEAPLGDDVFGEDPTVRALEETLAERFGMEAGLFCPSGTMTNQIAIRLHAGFQKEVICHQDSHIYLYEGGGIMANSHSSVRLLPGAFGKITAEQVEAVINPDDVHAPETSLVAVENTMNKGGGAVYTLAEVEPIRALCADRGLVFHLDGARLFNALVVSGESEKAWGATFDTISICLSKGLGCPVGSVLLGDGATIHRARRVRKVFGGGMRQAGMLAAAGLYALEHHVERLAEDHARAQAIGKLFQAYPGVEAVLPVATNIVIVRLAERKPEDFLGQLAAHGVYGVKFGAQQVRFVTHLDIRDAHVEQLARVLKQLAEEEQDVRES
ncbi:aromatic amino acid beta-eliminating lyase/threonine aldolase [Nitritalea halalkaliphila LW7]|uniref:Aromatic amino acid beta-eliminating lyase/threonine aldolase n=1 Tax=Nitritalea halalkaliphila LW7 TaxID=1189621 RepID=I5C0N4_9BACT|nr:GntG family PLP-dependent aldolase [Nitritalea halalkaliphila]EIM75386.1 aromatic amino acid beta-eliminating lyase/threonine aldolase [Nitritalea halalkaliphila LW7]